MLSRGLIHAFSLYLSILNGSSASTDGNQTIASTFPQLQELSEDRHTSLPSSRGGRNVNQCCALAIRSSLFFDENNNLTLRNSSAIKFDTTLNTFASSQFPCGAKYIGKVEGAPSVRVNYQWCRANCGGWQISSNSAINEWVSPLIGFVVPSIVFCLSIPRRLKVNIPDGLFDVALGKVISTPQILLNAPLACIMVTVDTIFWLMTIFALAGPILYSGVYEAALDQRILKYVDDKRANFRLSVARRAHLLFIILIGNLDMLYDPQGGDDHAWNHLLRPLSVLDSLKPVFVAGTDVPVVTQASLGVTKIRLGTMLASQWSFGITVGAPALLSELPLSFSVARSSTHSWIILQIWATTILATP